MYGKLTGQNDVPWLLATLIRGILLPDLDVRDVGLFNELGREDGGDDSLADRIAVRHGYSAGVDEYALGYVVSGDERQEILPRTSENGRESGSQGVVPH